jgi:prepilin-type N-terminal cleavage/methylation domain-containing protein
MNKNYLFAAKEEGFSLIEMMVAIGVLGVLSLGVVKLMDNSNKAAKTIDAKDEISMLTREIVTILSNPDSCFSSLGDKSVSPVNTPNVPNIFRMSQGTPVAIPKLTAQPSLNDSPTLFIKGMRVKSIDLNGDGDRALATLEVTFNKPKNTMGGQAIIKEITLNANTCLLQPSVGPHTTASAVKSWCSDLSGKLIEGPNQSEFFTNPPQYYGTCQICNSSTQAAKVIHACQSTGSGGEVDLSSIDAMTCANLGGSYDGTYCLFGSPPLPFDQHILRQAAATLPQCIMIPGNACPTSPAVHTVQNGAAHSMSTNVPVTMYNISCTGQYKRRNNAACIAGWNSYAHTTQVCTTTSSSSSGSCYLPNLINGGCWGCGSGCFDKTSESCGTTSQFQQNQTGSLEMIKCCKPL